MTTPSAPPTVEETRVAQALIAQEQAELRAGLTTLSVIFGVGVVGTVLIGLFVTHRFEDATLPVAIVIALIVVGIGLRVRRMTRAVRAARRFWKNGQLSTGELALDAARRYLARQP